MKQLFLIQLSACLLLTAFISQSSRGQGCLVVKDSIIAGARVSTISEYFYNNSNQIVKGAYTDSGSVGYSYYDSLYYNGSGELVKLETYGRDSAGYSLRRTVIFTYSSGKVVATVETGTSNNSPYYVSHTITYGGNGLPESVTIDSMSGNVDFPASFDNFNWVNGNALNVDLVLGGTTVEVEATYDTKNNIMAKLYPDGATSIFLGSSANNQLTVTVINQEILGPDTIPAGSKLVDHEYTYNSRNDVETEIDHEALFDKDSRTIQYLYDCTSGINGSTVKPLDVYPNPAGGEIRIEAAQLKGIAIIFDINGKEVMRQAVSPGSSTINISSLKPGMYYVEVADGGQTYRSKVLKN